MLKWTRGRRSAPADGGTPVGAVLGEEDVPVWRETKGGLETAMRYVPGNSAARGWKAATMQCTMCRRIGDGAWLGKGEARWNNFPVCPAP